jgi:hypothetical protein
VVRLEYGDVWCRVPEDLVAVPRIAQAVSEIHGESHPCLGR